MVLIDGYIEDAIRIIKQALFKRSSRVNYNTNDEKKAIDFVPYSLQLWELYLDLERNFGTFQTIRAAYKRMMEIKVITPFILISYAAFLEENAYYEESFKAFEYGISQFTWPSLYDVW